MTAWLVRWSLGLLSTLAAFGVIVALLLLVVLVVQR